MPRMITAPGLNELLQWNLHNETGKVLRKTHKLHHLSGTVFTLNIMFILPVVRAQLSWETTKLNGDFIEVSLYLQFSLWIIKEQKTVLLSSTRRHFKYQRHFRVNKGQKMQTDFYDFLNKFSTRGDNLFTSTAVPGGGTGVIVSCRVYFLRAIRQSRGYSKISFTNLW